MNKENQELQAIVLRKQEYAADLQIRYWEKMLKVLDTTSK